MHAMPLMLAILCLLAIAYRYYSAFIAAKIAVLDDTRPTPAAIHNDGQNYHPTNRWVLFGHHFAAISGAGPLIGPVLAAQFGYLPGLLWIVIGVCLGGAVQDFLVLVASMRRDGRSLAQIAFGEIGKTAGTAAMVAILFIIIIALAGLGKVVVKALGGEEVKYPADAVLVLPAGAPIPVAQDASFQIPPGCVLVWADGLEMPMQEGFRMRGVGPLAALPNIPPSGANMATVEAITLRDRWRLAMFARFDDLALERLRLLATRSVGAPPSAATGEAVFRSAQDLFEARAQGATDEHPRVKAAHAALERAIAELPAGHPWREAAPMLVRIVHQLRSHQHIGPEYAAGKLSLHRDVARWRWQIKEGLRPEPETRSPALEQYRAALQGLDQDLAISIGGTMIARAAEARAFVKLQMAEYRQLSDLLRSQATPVDDQLTAFAAWASDPTAIRTAGLVRLVPGSSWGTFTIACTVPIALFVGLYMYKIRKGHVVEASLIGGAMTLVATVVGGWVSHHSFGQVFNLSESSVVWAMAGYGFIASVLPVWVLLCPRDYLSSFLKIGTIGLLVIFTLVANPKLEAPAINSVFTAGGPVVSGRIFPFLFITIMCGAISGFHTLVSSGTSPKMIKKERDARVIGYGAMLIEGLVGVVAMVAAATLPVRDYYAMNTPLADVPAYHDRILQVGGGGGIEHIGLYEDRTQESLRGRTGGAVTLAVGFAHIFDQALGRFWRGIDGLWKYWYHFAIMFEALFILTTIDTGTRIGRFLLQEVAGKVHPKLGRTNWWPGAIASTFLIVLAWGYFINANSMAAIWPMFGVANQMLAVIALAIVSVVLINEGKMRYVWVTLLPMIVVMVTTSTGAVELFIRNLNTVTTQWANPPGARNVKLLVNSAVQGALIAAMLACAIIVVVAGAARVWKTTSGFGSRGVPRGFPVIEPKEAGKTPATRDGMSA